MPSLFDRIGQKSSVKLDKEASLTLGVFAVGIIFLAAVSIGGHHSGPPLMPVPTPQMVTPTDAELIQQAKDFNQFFDTHLSQIAWSLLAGVLLAVLGMARLIEAAFQIAEMIYDAVRHWHRNSEMRKNPAKKVI